MAKRKDTKLESTAAEYLVLGYLLREGIQSFKAADFNPGYDLIATNPKRGKSCRIQVKSRWATDSDDSFPIQNLHNDFVVFVALNCGYSFAKKGKEGGRQDPVIYVFPTNICEQYRRNDDWKKLPIKKIPNYKQYILNWELVKEYLGFIDIQ